MKVAVLGGGVSGQLVQHVIPDAEVFDWSPKPERRMTREWGANYLWEPIPGLEYRSFDVITHIDGKPAIETSVMAYKRRVGKTYEVATADTMDHVLHTQFRLKMTGYELTNPIPATVTWEHRAVAINLTDHLIYWQNGRSTRYDWLVSTIPLYALLELIEDHEWQVVRTNTKFESSPIYVRAMPKPPDAPFTDETLYVNYLTTPEAGPYRYCDRGRERHYEGLHSMGSIPSKKLVPGKIHDLPPGWHERIMIGLRRQRVWCIGRYGAWRSDELVHETYREIRRLRGEVFR